MTDREEATPSGPIAPIDARVSWSKRTLEEMRAVRTGERRFQPHQRLARTMLYKSDKIEPAPHRTARSIADLDPPVHPAISIPVALANDPADRLFDIDRLRRIIYRRRSRP